MFFKNWFRNKIHNTVLELTECLYIDFRLIDQNNNCIGTCNTSHKPSIGDKIILNDSTIKVKPKMLVVKQVYISQTGFTGIIKGNVLPLDSNYY